MYKIALTSRKTSSYYFLYQSYYHFLTPYFEIEIITPRLSHQYQDIASRNDALLITGGDDIDPKYYHQKPLSRISIENQTIERMDFDLIKQFYKQKKTIIGICRGIQVINVYFGGTLYQDIFTQYQSPLTHTQNTHTVFLSHSLAHYFPTPLLINSFHHQAIHILAPQFQINAISEDGIIEGIEYQNILGVQWHPEKMDILHQRQFIQLVIDFIQKDT